MLLAIIGAYFFFTSSSEEVIEPVVENNFALVGTWESTDDAKFVRSFVADGSVIDAYEDTEDSLGTWEYITDLSNEPSSLPDIGDVPVVKLSFTEEVFYFSVVPEGDNSVSMAYLNGNGILNFTRVTEE